VAVTPTHLVDKSAWVRFAVPEAADRMEALADAGRLATCAIVDLEILYSARSDSDYQATAEELAGFRSVPISQSTCDRAIDVQRQLARVGHHRVPIPDLLIAAAAESAGLAVLHYDADFDVIAGVTGQAHEWVLPQGSV
jgi:predicted nucleic acid-binding protein